MLLSSGANGNGGLTRFLLVSTSSAKIGHLLCGKSIIN